MGVSKETCAIIKEIIGRVNGMTLDEIEKTIERRNGFKALESIYRDLPKGDCPGCARCCYDAVPASLVEFMQIRKYLVQYDLLDEKLFERVYHFILTELDQINACPFLIDNRCMVYPVRPLTCRLFGFQSRTEQNQRRVQLKKSHKKSQRYFRKVYGYEVSDAVINHVIEFCEDFVVGEKWSRQKSGQCYDELMRLDSHYFIEKSVPESWFNKTLVDWILMLSGEELRVCEEREKRLIDNTIEYK